MTAPTPPQSRFAALLIAVGLFCLLLATNVRGGPVVDGVGQTTTVTWSMSDPTGLHLENVAIEDQSAVLAWNSAEINWTRGEHFSTNGTLDPTLAAGSSGLELASDGRNYVQAGDFSAPGSWQLSPTQNVSVVEEVPSQDAYLGHVSPASAQTVFNSMDDVDANWTSTGSSGSTCNFGWVSPDHAGTGAMIQCNVSLGSPPGSYAGIAWPVADWSAYDRLVLWVFADDPGALPWSFRMSAVANSVTWPTTLQLLGVGWQEITVDLTEFGPDRSALSSIRFLVVGSSIDMRDVDFDDVRLTNVKSFNETGRLEQVLTKSDVTSSSLGSASLAFDYQVVNNSGIDSFEFQVNLSGQDGFSKTSLSTAAPTPWTHLSVDVSAFTSAAGAYALAFSAQIVNNGTVASNASVRIDNVTIAFPNRRDGVFLSDAIDFGSKSQFLEVRWMATIPSQTSVGLMLRSGNESDTNGPSWSSWSVWMSPGTYSPPQGPGRFLQIQLDLTTLNASQTPVVNAVDVQARHRISAGLIEAAYDATNSSFRQWSLMNVQSTIPGDPRLSIFIDSGQGWQALPTGGRLSSPSPMISWRILLASADGSDTPQLQTIVLTFVRPDASWDLASILLSPAALGSLLALVLGYSVYVVARRRAFSIEDLFLISREGRLIIHNTRRMRPDRDEDILSGMLTAILAFIKDSDPEEHGELRHFKVGDKTTVLEKGAHSYVAAVYSGRVPRWSGKDLRRFMRDVETRFGGAIAEWSGDPEDLQGIKEFTSRFVSRVRYRSPRTASRRAA